MECMIITSFRLIINGERSALSPYLFIICMNVLSCKLIQAEEQKRIKGVKVNHKAPPINHLLYADNLIMFFKADLESYNEVKSLLNSFGAFS